MSKEQITIRGDSFGPDGLRFWQPIDFCADFDQKPSVVIAAIDRLQIAPTHDFGLDAKLYGVAAFDRLDQHFRDIADLDAPE